MQGEERLTVDWGYKKEFALCMRTWLPKIQASAMQSAGPEQRADDAKSMEVDSQAGQALLPTMLDVKAFEQDRKPVKASTETKVKDGWLWKEGHKRKSWKRRYFRLLSSGQLK